jgi:hypothetical protein
MHLAALGHEAHTLDLRSPFEDRNATYHDHATEAAEQVLKLGWPYIDALVAHSGGAHIVPGIIRQLGRGAVGRRIYVSGSFGAEPRGRGVPEQRSTWQFRDAIIHLGGGRTLLDSDALEPLFLNDCEDNPDLIESLKIALIDQYRPEDEPPWTDHRIPAVPGWYILPADDRVREQKQAQAVVERTGLRQVAIDGGHCPNYSRPGSLARLLIDLAARPPDDTAIACAESPPLRNRPLVVPIV